MVEKLSKLSLDTVVPMGMVISFIGGAFWLGTMHKETQQTQAMLVEFRKEYKQDMAYIIQKIDKISLSNPEKKLLLTGMNKYNTNYGLVRYMVRCACAKDKCTC